MADMGDYVAYAADGYARIKGISALITTFGVGKWFTDPPHHQMFPLDISCLDEY